MNTTSSNRF